MNLDIFYYLNTMTWKQHRPVP